MNRPGKRFHRLVLQLFLRKATCMMRLDCAEHATYVECRATCIRNTVIIGIEFVCADTRGYISQSCVAGDGYSNISSYVMSHCLVAISAW